jgi:rhamnulose-1-phosphate aldolase
MSATGLPWNDALRAVLGGIADLAALLWEKGWAERNAGNVSVDVTDAAGPAAEASEGAFRPLSGALPREVAGRCFLAKATGSRFRDIARRPEGGILLLRVSEALDGYRVLGGGDRSGREATSEFLSHLKVHGLLRRRNLPQRAVLHTHPTHLIALTHAPECAGEDALNRILWAMHPEVKVVLPEGAGLVPYVCPGTEALADATLHALDSRRLAVWRMHGAVAVGADVAEAFDLADTADKAARIYLLCKGAGFQPEGLTRENLEELERKFGKR